jgi:ethanolamine utilization protein EutQ
VRKMPRRLFSAAEIRTRKECGETRIELAPDDLVTPEAVDVAKDLGIALVRMERDPLEADVRAVVKAMSGGALDRRPPQARGVKVRLVRGNQAQTEPFGVDVKRPDMNIRTKDVITAGDGSQMGAGLMSFEQGSFPWTLNYDEIDYVIEGELEIRVGDESYIGSAGDVIFIPRGTSILFCTSTRCRFLYVTYPANWSAQ